MCPSISHREKVKHGSLRALCVRPHNCLASNRVLIVSVVIQPHIHCVQRSHHETFVSITWIRLKIYCSQYSCEIIFHFVDRRKHNTRHNIYRNRPCRIVEKIFQIEKSIREENGKSNGCLCGSTALLDIDIGWYCLLPVQCSWNHFRTLTQHEQKGRKRKKQRQEKYFTIYKSLFNWILELHRTYYTKRVVSTISTIFQCLSFPKYEQNYFTGNGQIHLCPQSCFIALNSEWNGKKWENEGNTDDGRRDENCEENFSN